MYLEAEVSLSFVEPTTPIRVPASSWIGRVLHLATLGRASDVWEQEGFVPREMLEQLRGALEDVGLTNIISIGADDETVFRDDLRRDLDLGAAFEALDARASEDSDWPASLELVAEHEDDVATYVVSVVADRVHPVEQPPLRLRVYALLREFDVKNLNRGYRGVGGDMTERVRSALLSRIRTADGVGGIADPVGENLLSLCVGLEASLREHLGTDPTEAVIRSTVVRPRAHLSYPAAEAVSVPGAAPIFRPYAGMADATYYLRLWLPVLHSLGARMTKTLFVDEAGRPVFHIDEEPLDLARTRAVLPGEAITDPLGVADVVYFWGSDHTDELRAANCLRDSDAEGPSSWDRLREREIGVRARGRGFRFLSERDRSGGLRVWNGSVDLSGFLG